MYKLLRLFYFIAKFKKEEKDFHVAAMFHAMWSPEGAERDKAVGSALMSAETARNKIETTKKLIKHYALRGDDGLWSKREVSGEVSE